MALNHITIMGRLTKEPERRQTQSGKAVANFTLAVDRDYAEKGAERETDFIECVAWRGTAEFVDKYFGRGQVAVVSGRLQMRDWTDKEGNKRRSAEVIAESVYFGDGKRETLASNTDNSDTSDTSYGYSDFEEINNEDDLPF